MLNNNKRLMALPDLGGCTALRRLTWIGRLYGNDAYDRLALPASLSALSGLQRLQLARCKGETLPPAWECFPQLQALDVSYSNIAPSQLLGLTACTKLAELRVASCCHHVKNDVDDEADPDEFYGAYLPSLAALPALSNLHLEGYERDEGEKRFPDLAGLTRLSSLEVSRCFVKAAGLAPLAGLTALVELKISSCHLVLDLPSLSACEQLQRLRIESCCSLRALPDVSGCVRLKKLLCKRCFVILPCLSLPDLTACTDLRSVTLHSCPTLFAAPGFDDWVEELGDRASPRVNVDIIGDRDRGSFSFSSMFGIF